MRSHDSITVLAVGSGKPSNTQNDVSTEEGLILTTLVPLQRLPLVKVAAVSMPNSNANGREELVQLRGKHVSKLPFDR